MRKSASLMGLTIALLTCLAISTPLNAEKPVDPEQEMEIKGLGFDQLTQTPVVLLADKKQETVLPIWIGLCEARSIEIGLSGVIPPRPLTYDMVAAIIRSMNAEVKRIVISDLRDQVYYAQIEMSVKGKVSKIDARPSDAIALASRMGSPIFVKESVIEKAALIDSEVIQREL